jgi:membrane-associated phospholipid phosphatase
MRNAEWKKKRSKGGRRRAEGKTITILAFLVFCMTASAGAADKTFINRIFFDDFGDIGRTIVENPVQSSIIAGSVLIAGGLVFALDRDISGKMKQANDFNNTVFDAANYLGDGVFVLAANSFLFLGGQKEKNTAQLVIESVLVSGAITQVVKIGLGRTRPSGTADPYQFLPFSFSNQSMPSGHSSVAFSWAAIIGDTYDIGWLTYTVAGLVAWARVYKNAHWPSDVLIGGAIGVVTAKILKAARDKENENIKMEIKYSELNTPCLGVNIGL